MIDQWQPTVAKLATDNAQAGLIGKPAPVVVIFPSESSVPPIHCN